MKTAAIAPAHLVFDAEGQAQAPDFGDRYHARAGALAQAEHVFLRGNGLPQRWAGRRRFVVLETGFGLGHNFIATWLAWQRDPARCEQLHFVAVEKHPPRRADLQRAHAATADAKADPAFAAAAAALQAQWPPFTGDLHRLRFERGRVELLLALGDAAGWLRALQLQADALYLDGFAPDRNPQMWSPALFAALPALCARDATAATWSVAREVRDGLATAGFEVERAEGFAGKREMTVARFAPRHRTAPAARRQAALPQAREAVVVGAGLAGAAAAAALAEQGLAVTVLEAEADVARGASGNPAGLFRGLLTRDDGAHARWHRAAALELQRQVAPWLAAGELQGAMDGVLQIVDRAEDLQQRVAAMAWPADYVQLLRPSDAAALAGLGLGSAAAWFPGGGWLQVPGLVRAWLNAAGAQVRTGCRVAAVQRRADLWQLCGPEGHVLAQAPVVVLANAQQAAALAPAARWVLGRTRGQVTRLRAGTPGLVAPRVPLARNGYVIGLPGGDVLCGATQQPQDEEPGLRITDHQHNLAVLARLTGVPLQTSAADLDGRVAWRCHTDDRLPLVGPLPTADAEDLASPRLTQPRHVPRASGLHVLAALGSRGIASAALGARTLAALVTGAPLPLDGDLLDAVDAARYISRGIKRAH